MFITCHSGQRTRLRSERDSAAVSPFPVHAEVPAARYRDVALVVDSVLASCFGLAAPRLVVTGIPVLLDAIALAPFAQGIA